MGFLSFKISRAGHVEQGDKPSANVAYQTTEVSNKPAVSNDIQSSTIDDRPTQAAALPFKTLDIGTLLGYMTVTTVGNGAVNDRFLGIADSTQVSRMAEDLERRLPNDAEGPVSATEQTTPAVSWSLSFKWSQLRLTSAPWKVLFPGEISRVLPKARDIEHRGTEASSPRTGPGRAGCIRPNERPVANGQGAPKQRRGGLSS